MQRKRVRVHGVVQGVGFRPFVWKRAVELGLTGWVHNDSQGVTLEIQGKPSAVIAFLAGFREASPALARIETIVVNELEAISENEFAIRESFAAESKSTPVSPDISICDDCLRELNEPLDRRYQYPFINCTHCGPRFTIVEDMPYDRRLTSMKSFPMCTACQTEYNDPASRRFHAQPNACAACGPAVWFVSNRASEQSFASRPIPDIDRQAAIQNCQQAIRNGQIVAVKGIGGFHLVCDACSESAIARLRQRKGRVDKPFALMVRDVGQAELFTRVSTQERRLLESQERPIVLLQRRHDIAVESGIPHASVAPGNNFVGVMLPYSPLHYLLLSDQTPLVFTSGNIADEPIVRTNIESRIRLKALADGFLLHDRQINVVCDDSLVRCVNNRLLPLRRSRGYAPLPVALSESGPSVLAVGAEIKSTFCVTKDRYAYMSQHIGDMGNLQTLEALQTGVQHFLRLFRAEIAAVAADLHPGYLSGQWADKFSKSLDVPLFRVQHHFAHVAALRAEHGMAGATKVIGCCFDGTGYGTDGAIWGGEFLLADGYGFQRFAHLKYTPLPGGDASIRRPYRVALAELWACGLDWDEDLPCVAACPAHERKLLRQQLERNLNCVASSSMGRLFDAVASLVGIRHEVNYEAQAAMEMETLAAAALTAANPRAYAFKLNPSFEIVSTELLRQICGDVLAGLRPDIIAAQFHYAVAEMVVQVCQAARRETRMNSVGLTGGVFQNGLLLELATKRLDAVGFEVLTHSIVPPNDGGIALGQADVVRNRLN